MLSRSLLCVAAVLAGWADASAPAPPSPAVYSVLIRYQIDANRNERVAQYAEMMRTLKAAGFQRDPDQLVEENEAEDVRNTPLKGFIDTARVPELLAERHVRTIRLLPRDLKLPDAAAPVRVHLQLASGYPPDRQRQLAEQTLHVLQALNFKEGVGYDHHGHTRLVGSIPAGKLDAVFGDLHRQPSAWTLLKPSLLSDMRSLPSGGDMVENVLLGWFEHTVDRKILDEKKTIDGKMLIEAAVQNWQTRPAAVQYMRELPAQLFKGTDHTVLYEKLIGQMAHHPDASALLDQLQNDATRNEDAADLMDILIRRLRGSVGSAMLPLFFRTASPVTVTEGLSPDMPLPVARPPAPAVPAGQEKLSQELRELLADAAKSAAPTRMEVLLATTPAERDTDWLKALQGGAAVVEGRIGSLVTVGATPAQASGLARLPEVAGIRLPRVAQARVQVNEVVEGWEPLKASGVAKLHAMGRMGRGTRVAVIDADFRGWKAMVGKKLPEGTRMVDLTRERNPDLQPDPEPGDPKEVGHGVHVALAVLRAAPEADLTLVRIDAATPYMLEAAGRAIAGQEYHSVGLGQRLAELTAQDLLLKQRREELLTERREILNQFIDENQKQFLLKKKEIELTAQDLALLEKIKKHDAYEKRQGEFDRDEKENLERTRRYTQFTQDVHDLREVRVVASALVWNEGHPVDGTSALSRFFDDQAFRTALWFQSAGDARDQAWSGLYRDDGDGVLSFSAPETRLPEGSWSRSLNFLAWRPAGAKQTMELPAAATVRVSLQWREVHDPNAGAPGEDPYRRPLADLRIVVLHEADPAGAKQPADDFDVAAESAGPPLRLEATPTAATYEQTVLLRVKAPGRYAVRIEGRAPDDIRPAGYPTIPATRKSFDLRPRLFVNTLEGPGRVVLQDFATEEGALGIPADSRAVTTVSAADDHGRRRSYSAGGPPHGMELLLKPDLLAFDQVETDDKEGVGGTGLAVGFAAGIAAASHSAGAPLTNGWPRALELRPNEVIRIPADFPRR